MDTVTSPPPIRSLTSPTLDFWMLGGADSDDESKDESGDESVDEPETAAGPVGPMPDPDDPQEDLCTHMHYRRSLYPDDRVPTFPAIEYDC